MWAARPSGQAGSPLTALTHHPPLPTLYPQWIVLKAWNNPGKVILFDSAVSLNYVAAFISKSKYKGMKERERETAKRHGNILWRVVKWHFNWPIDLFPWQLPPLLTPNHYLTCINSEHTPSPPWIECMPSSGGEGNKVFSIMVKIGILF